MKNNRSFAVIGASGYIAPKHLEAIKEIGGEVLAVIDPNDNLEVLDRFFPDCEYFPSIRKFEEFLKIKPVDFISICSPSYLHAEHIEFALQNGCNAICDSPLVLNRQELDRITEIEQKTGKKVYSLLQYRYYPEILDLKSSFDPSRFYEIELINHTYRGKWFSQSWKGDEQKSGGLPVSLGYHFFDFLLWIYGNPQAIKIIHWTKFEMQGELTLSHAQVNFSLCSSSDLNKLKNQREIRINKELLLLDHNKELFTQCYSDSVAGKGITSEMARPVIEWINQFNKNGK